MPEKYFNRKIITMTFYFISISLLLISIPLLVLAISIKSWLFTGFILLVISVGLMILALAVNRGNDIVINYENKEIISNIKFNNKEKLCIPFDSIVNVYEFDDERLKKDIKLKKYPKRTLVIERKYHKEYITLKGFDDDTVNSIKKELLKVRDSYENLF